MESLEGEKRVFNIVFLGVPESSVKITESDGTEHFYLGVRRKKQKVFKLCTKKMSQNMNSRAWESFFLRKERLFLVKLHSKESRPYLLKGSANLKGAGSCFTGISLKKEVHPLVKKELGKEKRRD